MKRSTREDYRQRLLRVLRHLQTHLDEAVAPADLAAIACFSPHHFHRIFRGMVGESVMQHVRRLRLERAAIRLKHSDRPVTAIAFEAGYEAHEAFTRAFGERFGCSPSEFRSKNRAIEWPAAATPVHYREDGALGEFEPAIPPRGVAVEVRELPARRIAYVRHIGPYAGVGAAFEELMQWAGPRGIMAGDAAVLGRCHDDPEITSPERIRFDACVTVGPEVVGEGGIAIDELPGGPHATTLHRGPFETLGETYLALFGGWLPTSGRELRPGPCIERYLDDPESTPPEELETEIAVPLEPSDAEDLS
ncbi:MAG: AraC family transcriptional regulator [Planctomycetes bacterium]|nr:AraC family transcriptional regulator [Planctomycetota bacterium]